MPASFLRVRSGRFLKAKKRSRKRKLLSTFGKSCRLPSWRRKDSAHSPRNKKKTYLINLNAMKRKVFFIIIAVACISLAGIGSSLALLSPTRDTVQMTTVWVRKDPNSNAILINAGDFALTEGFENVTIDITDQRAGQSQTRIGYASDGITRLRHITIAHFQSTVTIFQ
jgi:hypothetical protein